MGAIGVSDGTAVGAIGVSDGTAVRKAVGTTKVFVGGTEVG